MSRFRTIQSSPIYFYFQKDAYNIILLKGISLVENWFNISRFKNWNEEKRCIAIYKTVQMNTHKIKVITITKVALKNGYGTNFAY